MKKYIILAFKSYGVFICNEITSNKEVLLKGRFYGRGAEFTFIKHPNDILITQ